MLLASCLTPAALLADARRETNDSGWAVASPQLSGAASVLGPKSINLDRVVTPELIRSLKVKDTPRTGAGLQWQKSRVARRAVDRTAPPLKPLPDADAEAAPAGKSLGDRFEVSDLPDTPVVPETQALPVEPLRPAPTEQTPPGRQHRPAPFEADNAAPLLGPPGNPKRSEEAQTAPDDDSTEAKGSATTSQDPVEITLPQEGEEQDSRLTDEDDLETNRTPSQTEPVKEPTASRSPHKDSDTKTPATPQQKPAAERAQPKPKSVPSTGGDRRSTGSTSRAEPPKEVEKPKRELPPLTRQQQSLRQRIRSVLAFYYRRPLNSVDHDSWEVMHSMLSYGLYSRVQEGGRRSRPVTAIGHLCFNRPCKRYQMMYITPEGRLDVRVGVGMQGHKGQLMAMLAQCNVSPEYPIRVQGKDFTIHDLIAAEQLTCYARSELSFKLLGLMHYLPSDATWVNDQGETWDFPRLIADERTQKIRGAACGGTHRLGGLALAVRKRVARGEPLDGEWLEAHKMIEQYQQYAFRLQNRDGSLSTEWFRGPGAEPDIDRRIRTTGHLLEWLIYSLPDEEVATDKRVFAAVNYLTNLIMSNTSNGWEIGPLCHALHAMLLYDEKVFRPYDDFESPQVAGGKSRRPSKPNYLDLSSPFSESYFFVEARHEERVEREESGPFGGLFGHRTSSDRR
ncbi:MAG: hypothetical protein KDA37_07320 [Planctomycetales bacterium]|nr:hypothetical protein [Planctomycetales bacterium]